MIKANISTLKKQLPIGNSNFSSTCQCGICSGGSGTCKDRMYKSDTPSSVKNSYTK